MKRLERGFTLIEIMIVVAIIALLAAVAIPNVMRGRTSANEAAAIGNLRALISSLEMHRSVNNVYPDVWLGDMYGANCNVGTAPDPDFGPQPFCVDIGAAAGAVVQGYTYIFTELPAGCDNTAGNECNQYTVTAQAQNLGRTGTREFFVDESGSIRHCLGVPAGDVMAEVDEPTLDQPAVNCD